MKATNPGSRRRKIILYYTLAVVLPGIALGYMAYRGIRSDQALREKENMRRLEMNSQAFFSEIDTGLVQFIKEQTDHSLNSDNSFDDSSVLILVDSDSNGLNNLISHQLLYLPAELLSNKREQLNPPPIMKVGNRLEFIEHRYRDALILYQHETLKTTSLQERIKFMVASARLYNKMNQPEQAKALYEEIRKEYPGNLLNGQIPLALMASLELLKINHDVREYDEIRNNSRKYLELLLHPPCEYDVNQFEMFYQTFKEIIPENDPFIDSLFKEIDTHRARTDYLIRILSGPDLTDNKNNNHFKSDKYGLSRIPISSDELSAVYLSWNKNNSIQTRMMIDFPVYLKSISEKMIKKLDPGSSLNIKINDHNGKLVYSKVLKEETGYLSFPFPENFPQWKLSLSENKPGFLTTLMKSGSGIYLFIFILIALLMILGSAFIMYTLNVELRLNKLKSEFISNVSHELKSPLTSIRMMTEMLHHNRVQTEERKSAYYSAMIEEGEHLSHLIDNILDFSRMDDDRRRYDLIDLDLDELLYKFLESTRQRLQETGFDISYSRPDRVCLIKADKNSILQVFYNLVDNAIKFSGTSKRIDISLLSKGGELLFCVKDYGIGISGKEQEKIFERFFRGEEPQRLGIKGSGIGLTIVQKIIEIHNGRLTLESRPGEGSTFCVHLPIFKIVET
jgi:signal transduction histidine kinase